MSNLIKFPCKLKRTVVYGEMDHRSMHPCVVCKKDTIQETVDGQRFVCQSCGITLMHTDLGTVGKFTDGWSK